MNYTLKNGTELTLNESTRPPLSFWMRAKIMPSHLTQQYLANRNLIKPGEDIASLSDEEVNARLDSVRLKRELTDAELYAQIDFQYKAVEHCLQGKCAVADLTEEEFDLLYSFTMFGVAALRNLVAEPATEGAKVGDSLETFRQES